MSSKEFYDTVRPLFGGRITQEQFDGLNKVLAYGIKYAYTDAQIAYVLATVFHETNQWMHPIREGAGRVGPSVTHEQTMHALASLHSKGLVGAHYRVTGPFRQAYYGRGLVPVVGYSMYVRFDNQLPYEILKNPDVVLEWDVALDALYLGMRDGLYNGSSLKDVKSPDDFLDARLILTGDHNMAKTIADYAKTFFDGLVKKVAPRKKTGFDVAKELNGLEEVPGPEHNPLIIEMFAAVGHSWVKDDETAWCAAMLGYTRKKAGQSYLKALNARAYLDIGYEVSAKDVQPGDIVVLWREDPNSWKGHVGYFWGWAENGDILILGGNQRNAINVLPYPKRRLLGFRRAP